MDKITAKKHQKDHYKIPIIEIGNKPYINTESLFMQILSDLENNISGEKLIVKSVESIAIATAELASKIAGKYKEKKIFLCGEFFKHPAFLSLIQTELIELGYTVYLPKKIPLDDSGISIGQLIHHYFKENPIS
jgi:hydrogenase maturation protein HypF